MSPEFDRIFQYNEGIVRKIFKRKEEFHRAQARLPIEDKIKILVELQKIALTIRPKKDENDRRIVWRIE
jgi:hypothetical protein